MSRRKQYFSSELALESNCTLARARRFSLETTDDGRRLAMLVLGVEEGERARAPARTWLWGAARRMWNSSMFGGASDG